ncbi:uroporphyrinogen-III synthase [Roseiflexus castenholzii]|jgi:uroporphyrinogen-III synthase|uniref:Uroporphyrinogen III synthase HEM4 n=1 Tax=Roseiflexus castenholzii (strain DSM 13941 / HLO8) TaxID=383372 RepID=A7NKU9_ROSCS|nr:uroporphyrinogen-III synthase [Roseiflexus castenholzii]ABU58119.1 Uroporphyrinogen III synthase HEM4 [Roseiflexus castenholzii DSM 13941]
MDTTGQLQGKRIAVTRAAERAEGLAAALSSEGAEVLVCPTIAYAPPDDPDRLEAALERLDQYDWIIFTSVAAVDTLARYQALPPPLHVRVAAVGKATAAAIESRGGRVDLLPAQQNAEGLLAELRNVAGQRFLLPVSDIARDTLAVGLREREALVDVVTAYRTVPGPGVRDLIDPLCRRAIDAVVFSSPSTLRYLIDGMEQFGIARSVARALFDGVALIAIGPTTAQALRDEGLSVAAQAPNPAVEGVAEAVCAGLNDVGARLRRAHGQ